MKTLLRAITSHVRNIGFAFSLLAFLAGTVLGQGTLDCGKYPAVSTPTGPFCRRVGILPWFVGTPGEWETELRLGVAGDTVRFSYVSSLSLTSYDTNLVLENSSFGSTSFESEDQIDLPKYGSNWTRILGACSFAAGQCPPRSATGSIIVTADAPNAAALEAISAFGVYKNTSNGSVVSQTTAPVIFLDQAAVRWTAIVLETPRAQQSQPDATITTFAVANLSPDPQAVLIRVYNERGNLLGSTQSPVLDQALEQVGGVYADLLSNVLGINLPVSYCPGCADPTVFRGTVVFEGEKGGPIAPVVFQFNGQAMTAVPVRGE
jgi:hypothetical protein